MKINLKAAREKMGLSQNELAQKAGISPQNIQKLEQNRSKGVQFDTLSRLCDALSCQPGDLLVYVSE